MSGDYGTAYGREIKPQKLGREALGLAACEAIDTGCLDCSAPVKVTLEPYGPGLMAVIVCPNCGTSYDTNLDPVESGSHD